MSASMHLTGMSQPQGLGRVRRVHFVGIGGAGMSGIAEVLHNLGYEVSGSDVRENAVTRRLGAMGITISVGHAAANIADCDAVVVSTAIPADNPEIIAARAERDRGSVDELDEP